MQDTALAIAFTSIAFLLSVIWGTPFIQLLRDLKIGKVVRSDVPESTWRR